MSVALLQEVRFAIGFKQQADLVTALVAADMVSLRQTNSELIHVNPINEDDGSDYGKGIYITETFKSNWDTGGPWNGRLSSESMAIISSFAFGSIVKTGTVATGGFLYTMHEFVPATDGLNLPVTTMAVQIRTGGSSITDKAIIGVACEEFGINYRTGPGRDNATFTSTWLGTGQNNNPSSIVIPTLTDEHTLNAGGVSSLTMIGFDYIANKRFVDFKFSWKNNIRDQSSFFPGSGLETGYQLRGRMRRGVPTISLTAQVECDSGSSEEDALLAQTEGTGVINIEGDVIASGPEKHGFKITFYRLRIKTTPISDADGIAAYQVDYFVMADPSLGVCKIEATTTLDDILTVAT